jgi:hypothetical protein
VLLIEVKGIGVKKTKAQAWGELFGEREIGLSSLRAQGAGPESGGEKKEDEED